MTVTTPALLFPAISLLLLAYTNRFVVLTNVIRQLSDKDDANTEQIIMRQIETLRDRLNIIRWMQTFGVLAFVACTISMGALLLNWQLFGQIVFGASLILLVVSLLFSLLEVQLSTKAISIELEKLDSPK